MHNKLGLTASLGGVLYPFLAIAGLLLMVPALPVDFEAPPGRIADHLAGHPAGLLTGVGASLEFTGLLMLVLFGYRLTAWLADDWSAGATAAVATVAATVKIAGFSPALVALWYADGLSPQTKATLFRLNDGFVPISEGAVHAFILLSGILILTSGRLARWLGWFAVVSALLAPIDLWTQTGILEMPSLLWLPIASIALTRAIGHDRDDMRPRLPARSLAAPHGHAAN